MYIKQTLVTVTYIEGGPRLYTIEICGRNSAMQHWILSRNNIIYAGITAHIAEDNNQFENKHYIAQRWSLTPLSKNNRIELCVPEEAQVGETLYN